ncbi:hypothetical protein IAT38_006789 [Cryptococcus sp. DSM 104549]
MPAAKKPAAGPGPPKKKAKVESETESDTETETESSETETETWTGSESETDSEPERGKSKGKAAPASPKGGRAPEPKTRLGHQSRRGSPKGTAADKASETDSDSESESSAESSEDEKRPQKPALRPTRPPARDAQTPPRDRSHSKAPPSRSPERKHTYPPSSQKSSETPEKKRGKISTKKDWDERNQKLHDSYRSRPPVWAGACGDCTKCWKGFWGWWFWRWLVRKMPYLLALAMIVSAGVVTASGDMIGIWVVDVAGSKYGGTGYCEASGQACVTQLMYSGPSAGSWPAITLPALLLAFGLVGIIQLFLLIFCYLFVRHNFQSCCVDIESQRSNRKKIDARHTRALIWFERTMTLTGLAYFIIGVMFAEWVSEADGDGLIGYSLGIFLLISPFIWFGLRMSYRSSWAYYANAVSRSVSKSKEKVGDKWDDAYKSDEEGQLVMRDKKGKNVRKPQKSRAKYD